MARFRDLVKWMWSAGATALLTACTASAPPPVSITTAINGVVNDLGKFHSVNLMDATSWDQTQQIQFATAMRTEQCRQKTADPIIVTLRDSILMKLTGSFTDTGAFSVGSAGMGMPSLAMSGSHAKTAQQELDVPVYMTTLSELSDYIYIQQKQRYQPIWDDKTQDTDLTYGQRATLSHTFLSKIADEVRKDYVEDDCPKPQKQTQRNSSVFYGAKLH